MLPKLSQTNLPRTSRSSWRDAATRPRAGCPAEAIAVSVLKESLAPHSPRLGSGRTQTHGHKCRTTMDQSLSSAWNVIEKLLVFQCCPGAGPGGRFDAMVPRSIASPCIAMLFGAVLRHAVLSIARPSAAKPDTRGRRIAGSGRHTGTSVTSHLLPGEVGSWYRRHPRILTRSCS